MEKSIFLNQYIDDGSILQVPHSKYNMADLYVTSREICFFFLIILLENLLLILILLFCLINQKLNFYFLGNKI